MWTNLVGNSNIYVCNKHHYSQSKQLIMQTTTSTWDIRFKRQSLVQSSVCCYLAYNKPTTKHIRSAVKWNDHWKSSITTTTSAEESQHHNYPTTTQLRAFNERWRNRHKAVNCIYCPKGSEAKKHTPLKSAKWVKFLSFCSAAVRQQLLSHHENRLQSFCFNFAFSPLIIFPFHINKRQLFFASLVSHSANDFKIQ